MYFYAFLINFHLGKFDTFMGDWKETTEYLRS